MFGTTIAIGDGANDAQMLAASDVGFAISREHSAETVQGCGLLRTVLCCDDGAQRSEVVSNKMRSMAALVCDVSIARFGFLPRLVQVHGVTGASQFKGMLHLNLVRCITQTAALVFLSAFADFSATDFMPFPLMMILNQIIVCIPMLSYVALEHPMEGHSTTRKADPMEGHGACSAQSYSGDSNVPSRQQERVQLRVNNTAWRHLMRHLRSTMFHRLKPVMQSACAATFQGSICALCFAFVSLAGREGNIQTNSSTIGSLIWVQTVVVILLTFLTHQRRWTVQMLLSYVLAFAVLLAAVVFLTQPFEFSLPNPDALQWGDNERQVLIVTLQQV